MICPQCAARNPLGSQRCRACAEPFTHEAYRVRSREAGGVLARRRPNPARRSRPAAAAGGWPEPANEPGLDAARAWRGRAVATSVRRRLGSGWLLALAAGSLGLVALLVALLLASVFVVKPIVRDAAVADLRAGVREEVRAQIAAQIADAPAGEIVITDDEINQRLAAGGDLGPIDDIALSITPDGISVQLSAYGLSGTYQTVVRAENGTVVLDTGALDGPLGLIIPNDDLASAANAEIAAALAAAGYQVEAATMGQGAIVLAVRQ